MVELRIWLDKVDNVKFVGFASSSVFDPEVEPLGVAFRQEIWLEDEIIFSFINLNSSPQVCTFKS